MMTKAIFYKEWIKTRWYFLLMAAVSISFTAYALLRINRVVTFKGADHLWAILLTRDNTFIDRLSYLPLLGGIALAIVQYVPEMVQKRLKLTLHLPYPQQKMITGMLAAGLAELLLLFALQYIIMYGYMQALLPVELVSRILLTATPWFICGIHAYLFTAAICLEPTWRMRIVNLLLMAGTTRLYFLQDTPEAYNSFIPWLLVAALMVTTLVFRSVIRFKEGCQD